VYNSCICHLEPTDRLPIITVLEEPDERSGSLVFQHSGPIDRGALREFWYVVPGSGAGELRGLGGKVTIAVTPLESTR
jgi:Protein of unknown function (DUF3224)